MIVKIPDISKQIFEESILNVLKNNYSAIGPVWVSHQLELNNKIYSMFKDHDKALIIIYLHRKTLNFYSKNFIKFSYEEYCSREFVDLGKFNKIELSKNLNIPKETTRRKIFELEKNGIIQKNKKNILSRLNIAKTPFIKPDDSVKRISNFLFLFSKKLQGEKILLNSFTSEELKITIKKDFTYIWKIYYDMQIKMMLGYKKMFKDYENWHIFGTCVVNQHLYSKKINEYVMNRKNFIESFFLNKNIVGVNAQSISDITGIPRSTVVRKLKNLVKFQFLVHDKKKHYTTSGNLVKKLLSLQNNVLTNLANFSTVVYNSGIQLFNKKSI